MQHAGVKQALQDSVDDFMMLLALCPILNQSLVLDSKP